MRFKGIGLLYGMAFVMAMSIPLRSAETDTDDTKLEAEQQQIDKDKTANTDDQKGDALAKQFKVPESTVQDLRSKGQGWGEITIGLATARQLTKTDPKTFPTLADALNKVESLRASGEGWGKIAKDLGFKLGPVVSAAHDARHEMHETRQEEMAEHHNHHEEMGEHDEKMERAEHPDHVEHSEHPEHPGMPDRPGH